MRPILIFWKYDIIPRATNSVEALNIDKLIFEYLPYPEPHKQMDKFLEENTEYTHIIVITNDVVVMPSNLQKLLNKVKENPNLIQSAVMNVDRNENSDKLNVCFEMPKGEYLEMNKWWN